jgi:radical SAM protein with 4Fe4S-binding SPASM domain
MERFVIEERVPCCLPELYQEQFRLPFEQPKARQYLGVPVKVVPMFEGYRLSTRVGVFSVENLDIIEALSTQGMRPSECSDDQLDELEQMHANGMLTDQSCMRYRPILFDQGEAYRHLYTPKQCCWFAMSPVCLELDLTSRCNLTCIHCCRESSPNTDTTVEMSSQELFMLLDQAVDTGVDEISFLGGEPTQHPHLLQLAYFVRKRGIDKLMLATNALEIHENWLEPLAILFTHIQISLHGASAKTHEAIVRRKGAFKQVLSNVRKLRSKGACITLACSVLESRPQELKRMLELAQDLGVAEIRFIPLSNQGRGNHLPPLQWQDYQKIGELISEARSNNNELLIGSGGFPTGEQTLPTALYYGCAAGLSKLHLSAKGLATGCSLLENPAFDARNQMLLKIWHSDMIRSMRKRVDCNCAYVDRCAGGCLSVLNNQTNRKEKRNG